MLAARSLYAISDLHLGGTFRPDWKGPGARLCSRPERISRFIREVVLDDPQSEELVLHGDVFDFLAEDVRDLADHIEPSVDRSPDSPFWSPFLSSEAVAKVVATRIASRKEDEDVVRAFGEVVAAGRRLTIMIGNHDLEIVHPSVRRAFEHKMGLGGGSPLLHWRVDGGPYRVGVGESVAILHGNATDPFNRVDYEHLGDQARWDSLRVPPGSRLVTSVMNPVKQRWPFIDLLKPEILAAIPLMLWLDPAQRAHLRSVSRLLLDAHAPGLVEVDVSTHEADVVGDPLEAVLEDLLGPSGQTPGEKDVRVWDKVGWVELLVGNDAPIDKKSLAPLRRALTALARTAKAEGKLADEPSREMRELVVDTWKSGASAVVAGHTHLALDITDGDRRYVNTGTWADVVRVGPELLELDDKRLREWVTTLDKPDGEWRTQADERCHFARIDLGGEGRSPVVQLCDFV